MASAPVPVAGTVLDAAGRAVGMATLMWSEGPVAWPDVTLLSQPDGRFVITAPAPGRYTLSCRSDNHGEASVVVNVGAGDASVTVHLPR